MMHGHINVKFVSGKLVT